MNGLRFNHVFGLLLVFCAASAFVLPRFVEPARAQVQNIYAPVSRPTLALTRWIQSRFDHQRVQDSASPDEPRTDSDIRQENLELRQMLAVMTTQLQALQGREAERSKLGPLGAETTTFSVSGGDAGSTESLLIGGTNLGGLKAGMAAVYLGGLAGMLQTPGLTGTRVQLITDRHFRVIGMFARYGKRADGKLELVPIATNPPLVRGEGNNSLLIEALPSDQAAEVHVGDWVLLHDSDWQAAVQGQPIGRVTEISHHSPGYAQLRLEPAAKLMQLRELMVVTKDR